MSKTSLMVKEYKNELVEIFIEDYGLSEYQARKMLRKYDFNSLCKRCNYLALHDDPEYWAERIFQYFQ